MIPGSYYLFIYLFIVTIATFSVYNRYRMSSSGVLVKDSSSNTFILALLCTIFIGLRPNDPVFADTVGYVAGYYYHLHEPLYYQQMWRICCSKTFITSLHHTILAGILCSYLWQAYIL